MYSVMIDLDGRFVLTMTGGSIPFWFSDHRYDSSLEAWLLTPDQPCDFREL